MVTRRTLIGGTLCSGRTIAQSTEMRRWEDLLARYRVPGAQVCFGDKTIAAGVADRESGRRMDSDTPFEAASLSKPVFAWAVLKLCEEKKLALDAALGEYLEPQAAPAELLRVTVKQVLTHTSGIEPEPPKQRPAKLLFTPGTKFAYSPHAFDYLQRAAERVTGQRLHAMVDARVFQPLGMRESVFRWMEGGARGHDASGTPGQTINERVERMSSDRRAAMAVQYPTMNFPNAASSLMTTARDYARFLLGVSNAEWLRVPEVDAGRGIAWGLALGLCESRKRGRVLWHWGDFGIFQNFAAILPQTGAALVSLTNGANGQKFNKAVALELLGEDLPCFDWIRA
ncbi:MAG: serine hydrolase domain-containing protein [Bryobacteraceae bacterium]|nr:serine hydrolase domain-containing protein [Bryobacteraceae bacterium]